MQSHRYLLLLIRRLRPIIIASLLLAGLAFLGTGTRTFNTGLVQAVRASPKVCSLATIRGNYVEFAQGTILVQIPGFPPPPVLFAEVGSLTADGAGNFSGKLTASVNGEIASVTYTGTYTVNPDCTYSDVVSLSSGLVAHDEGPISGGGAFQEIHAIQTDPGAVITRTYKRQ